MGILKTSVDTESNVKHYTALWYDHVGTYPKDCGVGSTITVLGADRKREWFCVYDGEKWNTVQPNVEIEDLVFAEQIIEQEIESVDTFTVNANGNPTKVANIVIDYNIPQIETATVVAESDITKSGTVIVTIISSKLITNPLVVPVPVLIGDNALVVAEKIRTSLMLVKELVNVYSINVDDADVLLTQLVPTIEGLDSTLNIAIENGTCEGLTDDVSSVSTQVCSTTNKNIDIRYASRDCEITLNIFCYAVPSVIYLPDVSWFGGSTPRFVAGNNVIKLFTVDGGLTFKGICIDSSSITDLKLSNPVVVGGIIAPDSIAIKSVTPIEPVSATAMLGILGVVSDGETVTIGTEIYEFKTSGNASEGKIKVDVSAGVTASQAVTALALAITSNATSQVTGTDGDADSVVITSKVKGIIGNDIALSEEMAHGVFTVATLENGVDGTVAVKGTLVFDADSLYVAVDDCTTAIGNWKKTALVSIGLA